MCSCIQTVRMDFFTKHEELQRQQQILEELHNKKNELERKLEKLNSEKIYVLGQPLQHGQLTYNRQQIVDLSNILECYTILGVCLNSTESSLVISFYPLYKNQHPSTESNYSLHLSKNGSHFTVVQHCLPPFIPVKKLEEKYLGQGVADFVNQVKCYLFAYEQRQNGLQCCLSEFQQHFLEEPEVNVAVTYLKLKLNVSNQLPPLLMELQYNVQHCMPDVVLLSFDHCDETAAATVPLKVRDKLLSKWRHVLLQHDLQKALSVILLY